FSSFPAITVTANIGSGTQGDVSDTASVSGGGSAKTSASTGTDATFVYSPDQLAQTWQLLSSPPSFVTNTSFLMTDGTVLVRDQACTGTWHKLTPDPFGNYGNGTWSSIVPLPAGYSPWFFSSAVLADGRFVVL